MIADYWIFFFMFLLFAWFFAGRTEYLLPQIALIGAILIETSNYVLTMSPDTTIVNLNARYTAMISPVILFLINISYVAANMTIDKKKKEG